VVRVDKSMSDFYDIQRVRVKDVAVLLKGKNSILQSPSSGNRHNNGCSQDRHSPISFHVFSHGMRFDNGDPSRRLWNVVHAYFPKMKISKFI
jgi:hypothetical protein